MCLPLQVPAYKMAPGATDMHLLRVCLRVGFDLEMADLLAHHIELVCLPLLTVDFMLAGRLAGLLPG